MVEKTELTKREREVLAGILQGKMNKEIGADLGITEKTVKAHVTGIYRFFGVVTRLQLALKLARDSRYVAIPEPAPALSAAPDASQVAA